jgi:hypothetical protein
MSEDDLKTVILHSKTNGIYLVRFFKKGLSNNDALPARVTPAPNRKVDVKWINGSECRIYPRHLRAFTIK